MDDVADEVSIVCSSIFLRIFFGAVLAICGVFFEKKREKIIKFSVKNGDKISKKRLYVIYKVCKERKFYFLVIFESDIERLRSNEMFHVKR